jgi:hypothetical protein
MTESGMLDKPRFIEYTTRIVNMGQNSVSEIQYFGMQRFLVGYSRFHYSAFAIL